VLELSDRFCNSRFEKVFEGKPKGFALPSYLAQSEDGIVISELQTWVAARYIPPGADYKDVGFPFLHNQLQTSTIRYLEKQPGGCVRNVNNIIQGVS
jgi:hypothetical protein